MTKNSDAPRLSARKPLALLALSLLAVALAPARARAQWTQPTPPDTNIHNINDGNVGIGTGATVPAERLVTMGNILGGNVTAHTKLYPSYDSQNNAIFELGYGTPTANIVPLASFVLSKNLTSGDRAIGALSFANSSILDGNEKRVAAIQGWTDLTTSSGSLRFYVTNGGTFAEKMRLAPSGFLGLGTSSPLNLLHVEGGGSSGQLRVSGTGLAALNLKDYAGGTDAKFYQLRTDSSLFRLSLINDSELAFVRQNILVANSAGNVGLGTDNASDLSFKLALKTDAANDGILLTGSTAWSFFASNLGEGVYNSIVKGGDRGIVYGGNTAGSPGGGFVITPWANATSGFRLDPSGNVGIGTATPSYKLHVSQGTVGIQNSGSDAVLVTTSGAANESLTTGWSAAGFGYIQGGVWGAATKNIVLQGGGGNVGIGLGMMTPAEALMVNGNISVHRGATPGPAELRVYNGGQVAEWAFRQSSATSHDLKISKSVAGVYSDYLTVSTSGNVGVGVTPSPQYRLDVAGAANISGNLTVTQNITGGTINAVYQDVAEWVPSEQKLEAGTVVVLDTERSNHVLASTKAYDTKVAGVVSAAPGVILGVGGEGKLKVATTGRVKVKVDATRSPVEVGDLLVTGDAEGVAMKSVEVDLGGVKIHRPGTIIGKALEPLASGTGEILVLLSLQ